ncbi:MAG TPA: EAL domain-containing protein [Acidimicrobiia bacterium]|nr:EAL domain-containing protein [Acidimicrobiia bacterium]
MNDTPGADVSGELLSFFEQTPDVVGIVDGESHVVYLNEAARKRLGVGEARGLTTADIFPRQTFARYYDEIRPALLRDGTWHGELAVLTGAGETVPMAMTIVANVGPGGEVNRLTALGHELEVPRAAMLTSDLVYDDLTNLPGRAILDDRLRVALAHAARDGRGVAVILADVDGMKDINDSFGHAAGDGVLQQLAWIMSRAVRSSDTVARFGGDEFVMLLDGLDERDTAWQVADRVRDAVCRAPVRVGEEPMVVTASFGLAVAAPGDTPTALLQRADMGMYRAKATGGARVTVVEPGADPGATTLADELAFAVSHGLIHPHVQPVVDLRSGDLVGYQGLARWEHPSRGLLDADEFVHAAASTPVMPVIDLAVLRRTAAAAAHRARRGAPLHAYGHLSRRLLGDEGVERYLAEIIDDHDIAASDLRIEIAHALVARRSRTVEGTLRGLHEIGVRIVLSGVDGECDVNEIVDYGFDELRLDRRLVHDTGVDPTRHRVALGTIALARALGLTVLAVGIENDADRDHMLDAGCDYGEGVYFGRVAPATAVDL